MVSLSSNFSYNWIYFEGSTCYVRSFSAGVVFLMVFLMCCSGRILETEAINGRATTLSQTGKYGRWGRLIISIISVPSSIFLRVKWQKVTRPEEVKFSTEESSHSKQLQSVSH